jgi:hypothetical protein
MKTSKNYCIVCNVKFACTANGMRFCAGCIHLDHSRKMGQMGTTLGQCDKGKNWGPFWHKCHYCPPFSEKSDYDQLSYSQIHFDTDKLSESPASGIEQLNFQQYLAECQKVEEGYKSQLLYQYGSPYCAKWYCHNCMTFEKQEALTHCQTCGMLRPDFTRYGKHDPDCFWSIKSDYPGSKTSKDDDEPKKFTHSEIVKDMIETMPDFGKERASLVSTVQTARRRYVHIADREIGKYIDDKDNSIDSYWRPDSEDSEDDDQIDTMLMDDEIPRSHSPTRVMKELYPFRADKFFESTVWNQPI